MSVLQLCGLKFDIMPVTTFDMVHLLLPFVHCRDDLRQKLVQYTENITLAQALVYPLLKFDAATLAVTALVCGARLITGMLDDELHRKLVELVGSSVKHSLQCRKVTTAHINLQNLVVTSDEAAAAHAEKLRAHRTKRKHQSQICSQTAGEIAAAEIAVAGEIGVAGEIVVAGGIDDA